MGLVEARSYGSPVEAELAKGQLESAGIPAFCFDENSVNQGWGIGVRLMVHETDLADARSMLRETGSPDAESDRIATDADTLRRHLALIALVPLVAWAIALWSAG